MQTGREEEEEEEDCRGGYCTYVLVYIHEASHTFSTLFCLCAALRLHVRLRVSLTSRIPVVFARPFVSSK